MNARVFSFGLLVPLAVPLVFGKFLLYPFVVYRTYFFYLAVDLLFLAFLLLYRTTWVKVVRQSTVMRFVLLFFAVKALTDLLGGHMLASVFGNYERMMGLLTMFHALLYLMMLVFVFSDEKKYLRLFACTALVGAVASLYGILQRFDIAFRVRGGDDRLFSTVGNPAFLAGFLLFAIFFGVFVAHKETVPWRRWLFLASSLVSSVALYLTATRGAIFGLAVGAVATAVMLSFGNARLRAVAAACILAAVMASVLLYALRGTQFVLEHRTLRRLASISAEDFSVRSRLQIWGSAVSAIREKPIFGYGEHGVAGALDRRFDPKILETWFDSSHNMFLDVWLAHGVFGVAGVFAVGTIVLRALYRRRREDSVGTALLVGAIASYGVQSLFIFDTLVVLLPLALVAGYAAMIDRPPGAAVPPRMPHDRVIVPVLIIFLCILLVGYVRPLRALATLTHGHRAMSREQDLSSALAHFTDATNLALNGQGNIASVIRDAAFMAFANAGRHRSADIEQLLALLRDAGAAAREKEGETSATYADTAKAYLAAPGPKAPIDEAVALLDRAIELSPRRIDLYYTKAQALFQKGNREGAIIFLESLLPLFPESTAGTQEILDRAKQFTSR